MSIHALVTAKYKQYPSYSDFLKKHRGLLSDNKPSEIKKSKTGDEMFDEHLQRIAERRKKKADKTI